MTRPLCGIFIGGAAKRMGGYPKGLLPIAGAAPGTVEPIVLGLRRLAESVDLDTVLVGKHAAYQHLSIPHLGDEPEGIGPMGGLRTLLLAAKGREVIALACDMPFVSKQILERLLAVDLTAADVAAVQTEPGAPLESFLARYRPTVRSHLEQAIASGEHSLQRVLRGLRVKTLLLSEEERRVAKDWDRWEEVPDSVKSLLDLDEARRSSRS